MVSACRSICSGASSSNAEPVLAVFAGYVLNRQHVNAGSPEMAQYTQEALEEIEYVSGPADSEWGKKRAADGFPEPFPLHYVEIGNEDWFDRSGSYDGRFTQMAKAIREKLSAAEDHRHRAGQELQARPVRRPLLPQRQTAHEAGQPVRQGAWIRRR